MFRNDYENVTYCFCEFDHWCNAGSMISPPWVTSTISILVTLSHLLSNGREVFGYTIP